MRKITMKDVAVAAGVSTTTVSHVINQTRYVEESTREVVLSTMKSLGYHPNTLARSLRSGETNTIGLIVPDASNLFFADIAKRIENIGYENGYSVILCNSDNNTDKQRAYINTLIAKQVDGAIFISSGESTEDLEGLVDSEIPIVVADRVVPLSLADVVLLDNKEAGYQAGKYLVELGHKKIACINGPDNIGLSARRIEGFMRALEESGIELPDEYLVPGDFQSSSGRTAMNILLSLPKPPTAVFALNDMMAIGAISEAHRLGWKIPDDISLIGFDDIDLASSIFPALTTVAQPIDEIAQLSIQLLMQKMQKQSTDYENKEYMLKGSLIIRESTKRYGE